MITKLWATIIALMLLVLVFLTFLLLQFFQNSSLQQTEQQLENIANKAVLLIEKKGDGAAARGAVADIADVYHAGSALFIDGRYVRLAGGSGLPDVERHFFDENSQLKPAITGRQTVAVQGVSAATNEPVQLVVVGVPLERGHGAVFVYQSIQIAHNAMDRSKKLIYLSVVITIILTTFFAFFLSTRIGLPLRKMRHAALQVARGNFDMPVPVITTDEVGELAVAFNAMRKELKSYVAALKQEKEQLAGIVDNMADGVLFFDGGHQIRASNPPADHFLKAWAYENNESVADWEKLPDFLGEWMKYPSNAQKQHVQELSAQGRFFVIILTPLFDADRLRGAVAVIRDMTEERKLDEMKEGFVANVSHELRTPISMIQGYSEAIIDDIAETDQEKKEMAKIVLDESKRLGRLVSELLDLAKLEAGYFQLNKRNTRIVDLFHHAVHKFDNLAHSSSVSLTLTFEFAGKRDFVLDPDRIEQVLTNLIDNALRHTPEQGEVAIKVRNTSDDLYVSVHDTGDGIAEEDLPFVFERFYKADKSRKRGKSGNGLGLSIAQHIVEAHGGDISVRSKKGMGTTFEFTLPAVLEKDWDASSGPEV
ncbi:MAG: ATP-binding protein [Sporolactobacillus sp.]